MTTGKRILFAMDKKGVSKTELSKNTGYSIVAINYWISERGLPNADAIIELCKALDVSADWLLGLEK